MSGPGQGLDVDQLVADLQERVRRARESGSSDDAVDLEFLLGPSRARLRPELTRSAKPIVGTPITAVKRLLFKLQYHLLDDALQQVNGAIDAERSALANEVARREATSLRLAALEATVAGLGEQIEALRADAGEMAGAADRIATWDAADVLGRLARLERRSVAPVPAEELRPVGPDLARLALDRGRFDDGGAARVDAYAAWLGADAPIVVLGCADAGALASGLAATGAAVRVIDPGEDAVAAARARGLDASVGDPLAALAEIAPGDLGGLVVTSVADRFATDHWLAFTDLLATRMGPGGAVVIELLNPTSVAGLALRMRDPTLPPPVHPDTVAFLLRAVGFADAGTRTFGAFPEHAPGGPELVVGRPLAAVLGRR